LADDDKKPVDDKAALAGKPEETLGVAGEPQPGAKSSDVKSSGEVEPAKAKDDAGADPYAGDIEVSELPDDAAVSTSISTIAAPPKTEPSKIDEAQEKTRGWIALALVCILLLIVVASFASLWLTSLKVADVKGLLEVILAPVVALVGSATGFYFGGKK
jgi:hypothetical protein